MQLILGNIIQISNMNTMDIQAQKAVVMEQFMLVNDINLINAIKSMLDYAMTKEPDSFAVPSEHQKLVMERFERVRQAPERLLDWEEAKKTLKA